MSIIFGCALFFASKFLYLSVTKDLGDKLNDKEIKEALELKSEELKDQDMNE